MSPFLYKKSHTGDKSTLCKHHPMSHVREVALLEHSMQVVSSLVVIFLCGVRVRGRASPLSLLSVRLLRALLRLVTVLAVGQRDRDILLQIIKPSRRSGRMYNEGGARNKRYFLHQVLASPLVGPNNSLVKVHSAHLLRSPTARSLVSKATSLKIQVLKF